MTPVGICQKSAFWRAVRPSLLRTPGTEAGQRRDPALAATEPGEQTKEVSVN